MKSPLKWSLRAKLLALLLSAFAAQGALLVTSGVLSFRIQQHLEEIRTRYLPKVGLRPKLQAQFERMQRAFQDAVSASDQEKLASAAELKTAFLRLVAGASPALDPKAAEEIVQATERFYASGASLSRALIAGAAGESAVSQIAEMQAQQKHLAMVLDRLTALDPAALTEAFDAVAREQRTATRMRLAVSALGTGVMVLLFLGISRDLLRNLAQLTAGFRRFGQGDFAAPITAASTDEFGEIALQANQMSQNLQRLHSERLAVDWITSGRSGLSEELRGELPPPELASRAVAFLCRYLTCPVGALYAGGPGGGFELLAAHGLAPEDRRQSFKAGEGLPGEAALRAEITVVDNPAGALRFRSALAQGAPRSVALVPIVRGGRAIALLELASLEPWKGPATEMLNSVREMLGVALEVARSRESLHALLAETELQRGALEEKNAALVQSRQLLERQAGELSRASAYKSQFLANMSHELRTPLNAIIGFSQMIHDEEAGPLAPQQKDFLADVLRSGRHLLQLINDVLDLSKVEAGKLDFRPEPIAPERLVSEVLAVLRTAVSTARVAVESWIDPALGEVVADPARLKQVLYNYVSNALKFTPAGGRISIRICPEGGEKFRLEVSDTGKGIAPGDLQRLFVDFQQLQDVSSPAHAGTGLGLALTRRLIEAQGGSVGVRSVVGEGSTFFAILPRKPQQQEAPRPPPETHAQKDEDGARTVLIIEDQLEDQRTLAEMLEEAGYAVRLADTGAAALALARERVFHAITLDLFLPDMSGLEVLRQLRADGINKDAPVVIVTVVAERGAAAGFAIEDVLQKPVESRDLAAALQRAGVAPSSQGSILVVDDDPDALNLISADLRQAGYEARCEKDGAAALRALQSNRPAAVILDLVMPGMNGFEFLENLRREPGGTDVPVIVWTSKDLSPEERIFLRASARSVLDKRQGASKMLEELSGLVRKAGVRTPSGSRS